jgi:tetratricopeptide (TPR) repeat protein
LAGNDNHAYRERSSRYQATKVAADVALNAGDIGAARLLIADLGNDARVLDAAQESSSFVAEVAARRRELATSASRMYWETGRHHAGVAYFTALLAAEPGLPWALAARGITYRLMGRHKDAITDLGAAIDDDPGYALALANRGEVRRLDRQDSDALADLEEAVRLRPDYAWAIGSRGHVYQALGRTAEAFADFEHALGLDPHLRWVTAARSAMTGRNSAC